MAYRIETIDLLCENGNQIFAENGEQWLIIDRRYIQIEVQVGKGGGPINVEDWDGKRDVTVIITFKGKKYKHTQRISELRISDLINIIAKFKGIISSIINIKSKFNKYNRFNPFVKVKKNDN